MTAASKRVPRILIAISFGGLLEGDAVLPLLDRLRIDARDLLEALQIRELSPLGAISDNGVRFPRRYSQHTCDLLRRGFVDIDHAEVAGEIRNDGVELLVGRTGASIDHGLDQLLPPGPRAPH